MTFERDLSRLRRDVRTAPLDELLLLYLELYWSHKTACNLMLEQQLAIFLDVIEKELHRRGCSDLEVKDGFVFVNQKEKGLR